MKPKTVGFGRECLTPCGTKEYTSRLIPNMTIRPYLFLAVLHALLWPSISRSTEALKGGCSAIFVAGATMGKDFTGKATSRVCRVTYRAEESVRVMDLEVAFHWMDLSTENEKRDQRMRDQGGLDSIHGTARSVSMLALINAGDERPMTIPITMAMGGVTNQVHGLVTKPLVSSDGQSTLEVDLRISQEKFGYDPITLLGFISVRDEVVVTARFNLPADPEGQVPIPEP